MDDSDKNAEAIGRWLHSDFGAAHGELPDHEQWLGMSSAYKINSRTGEARSKTDAEFDQQDKDFTIHCFKMALISKQPDYQYLLAIALIEGHMGLSPEDLLEQAAKAGRAHAQKALDRLRSLRSRTDVEPEKGKAS